MKGAIRAGAFLALSCVSIGGFSPTTSAQSNSTPSLNGFSIPAPHLRTDLDAMPHAAARTACQTPPGQDVGETPSNLNVSHPSTLALSSDSAFEEQQIQRLWAEQYRNRTAWNAKSSIVRYFSTTFDPVPVRLRKATFSCSLWTAIKRKNPLSLLNPVFLNLSW